MSLFFPEFFESNEYFIDEKVQFFKFENVYRVYDNMGMPAGVVAQRVPGWHKVLRLFLKKAFLPFTLQIIDNDDRVLVTLSRGWTFWLSHITISEGRGNENVLGYIKQKFRFFKSLFHIYDAASTEIGQIRGDWKAWNFTITDAGGNEIGFINKKWAGIAKELFTTADKYNVTILPQFAKDQNKILLVSTAITIDMVLKESK